MGQNTLKFQRGSTHRGSSNSGSVLRSAELLGEEHLVPCQYGEGSNTITPTTKRKCKLVTVRNNSGGVVYAGEVRKFENAAFPAPLNQIKEAAATDDLKGVVDPDLPAAGCADKDILYVVVEGPVRAKTLATTLPAAIAAGDYIKLSSGRIIKGTSTDNCGYAFEAAATDDTDTLIWIYLNHKAATA